MALNPAELEFSNAVVALRTALRVAGSLRRQARILLVDEDAQALSDTASKLEREGHRVHLASGGPQAIEVLEQAAFDLVLAEDAPGNGDGIALLEYLRSQQPQLPVVIVSANHNVHSAIDFMRRGAFDYLLKPVSVENLVGAVERALGHRMVLEENFTYRQNLEQVVQARTEMLRRALEELEHSYDITLEALGDALDMKDSETVGHSKRVTAYTIALAKAMGVKPAEIRVIARGAFLHDIGKMAIPDGILLKPGKLTPEEQAIMREHCARGYNILRKIPFLAGAAEIVFTHQEHYDGSGYPAGLRESEIPIGARIFAVSDTLDSITSDRPYRKASNFEAARAEIVRCSGTQFDPAVVDAFLAIPTELWLELRAEINNQSKRFLTFDMTPNPEPQMR